EARQFLVRIVSDVPVAPGVVQPASQAVGAVVRQVQEERPVLVLLDEANRVPRPEISQVARLLANRAVLDDVSAIESGRVTAGLGYPICEPVLRIQAVAQMPFAGQPARVTGLMKNPGQGAELAERVPGAGPFQG